MRCAAALAIIIFLGISPAIAQEQDDTSFSSVRLQALNKVTARVTSLTAKPGLPVSFGTIDILVKSCWKSPRDEKPEHAALMEIRERKNGRVQTEEIFSGWMFASSPTLSALEHPVYDITLLHCDK